MSLQFVPGICGLADPGVEGVVDGVEVVPHLVVTLAQSAVDLPAQAF